MAKDGKHGNAAVLGLHLAKTIESLLVSIVQKTQRIPETKRSLGTDGLSSNDIFITEDLATRPIGAKAKALTRLARMAMVRNMLVDNVLLLIIYILFDVVELEVAEG